ncbi:MAG: WbqC family protein [Bacteroidota bacterium]
MVYPLLYNGPVNYFARLVREEHPLLEQYDNYLKQTYRSRCRILGPNGVHSLSIPVKRKRGKKSLFKEIRVDYDKPWNKIHWKSLVAAYGTSPFFEFIRDDLKPLYERRFEFLVDLNLQMLEKTVEIMGLAIPVRLSDAFTEITGKDDPRAFIHPKIDLVVADPSFSPVSYHQVFTEKHGFQPNLSILDLLFNEGPNSLSILHGSLKT